MDDEQFEKYLEKFAPGVSQPTYGSIFEKERDYTCHNCWQEEFDLELEIDEDKRQFRFLSNNHEIEMPDGTITLNSIASRYSIRCLLFHFNQI